MNTTLELTTYQIEANRLDLFGRLADRLAHDMRNPLNSAVINMELLRRRVAGGQTDGALERLDALGRDVTRLHRLTDTVLLLLGPPYEAAPPPAEIDERIGELMPLLHMVAAEAGATFEYRQAGEGAGIGIGRAAFIHVLLNLAFRAARPVGKAGLRIELSARCTRDEVRLRLRGCGTATCGPTRSLVGDDDDADLVVARALLEEAGGRLSIETAAKARNGEAYVLSLPRIGMG